MKHTKVLTKTFQDNTGLSIELPALLIEQNGKTTVLWPLHKYLVKYKTRSVSWKDKLIQVVGLLLDYMDANQNCFLNAKSFFQAFADAMYNGTTNNEGYDPSGLYWLPKNVATAHILLYQLSDFSDWMYKEYGTKPLNPWRDASKYEEKLNWMALNNKSNNSFLGHLNDKSDQTETAQKAREIIHRQIHTGDDGDVVAFPEDKIHELLWNGFKNRDKYNRLNFLHKYNWRDIAITILLHGGGLRESEPFHLWVQDVMLDPEHSERALVRVYHPVDGAAPKDFRMPNDGKPLANREAYLKIKYGLKPRTEIIGINHAGWKSPKLSHKDKKYMHVFWFQTEWGRLFLLVWKMYMARRIQEKIPDTHPYLFVSFRGEDKGNMYTMKSYNDSHNRAVERIGLNSAKELGTTEHGHRHAYGQRLSAAGLDGPVAQAAFHHKSDKSQKVYTNPTIKRVTEALEKASAALENGQQLPIDLDIDAWYDQDWQQQHRIEGR